MKPLDDTPAVCKKFGARYVNQRLPHFGGAFRTGIKAARYDKFLIMDSDGSHNPIYIPDIYKKFVKGADVVIGSRYVKGGKTNDSKVSIIMSHILNFVFRIITGIKAKDIFPQTFGCMTQSSLKPLSSPVKIMIFCRKCCLK